MTGYKIAAVVLIVAGILGLVYGQFTYTKETHSAKLGPIDLSVTENKTVNVPVWAGAGSTVLGAAMLVFALRKQ